MYTDPWYNDVIGKSSESTDRREAFESDVWSPAGAMPVVGHTLFKLPRVSSSWYVSSSLALWS